ncbi:TetR family transcriptional regulator [Arthrobacter sp. GMC3]|uniref:acyl-CoA-like ligand-binding transcription factor n=1 Tax=Arthrobacter sp. GMC3 TaxID=2058894 RepID=UPI0015E3D5D1|nr:TetR family transcriptional regulator [Arthrobacter sp. GMC3]
MQLFRIQGYDGTTMGQVAAASLVSESTLYRHFPSKADLVLSDELDPLLDAAFAAQPPGLTTAQAISGALRYVASQISSGDMEDVRERVQLFWTLPELRAAALEQMLGAFDQVAAMAAARTGRPLGDPALRTLSGALVGVAMAALFTVDRAPEAKVLDVVSTYLDGLEAALRL